MHPSDYIKQTSSCEALQIQQVPVNAAIVDSDGRIVAVNDAWMDFGRQNGLTIKNFGVGSLYRDSLHGEDAEIIRKKFDDLLSGRSEILSYFYPCHSPDVQRWFFLIGRKLANTGAILFHIDITGLLPANLLSAQIPVVRSLLGGELLDGIARVVEASVTRTMANFMDRGVPGLKDTREAPAAAPLDSLTVLSVRQRQVLALLAQGKSNEEIGAELSTSVNTVKLHVSAILRRLNLRSRTQAALFATRLGNKTQDNN